MKTVIEYAELRTFTPELGVFVITGTAEEVKEVGRYFPGRSVSDSTFDRLVYGRPARRRLAWFA